MGPQPGALHVREVGWAPFGVQRSPRSSLTSGSYQRGDGVVVGEGGRVRKRTRKRATDGGEKTRDRVGLSDKGERKIKHVWLAGRRWQKFGGSGREI